MRHLQQEEVSQAPKCSGIRVISSKGSDDMRIGVVQHRNGGISQRKSGCRQRRRRRCDGVQQPAVWLSALIVFAVLVSGARGQIGEATCACSPSVYRWKLDLSESCPTSTVEEGPGTPILDCSVVPALEGDPDSYNINSVEILELDQQLLILSRAQLDDTVQNGDVIEFESSIANPDNVQEEDQIPRAINVVIVAENAGSGEEVVLNWILTFSNACDVYPVVEAGDWIAWTNFMSVEPPPVNLCPLVAEGEGGSDDVVATSEQPSQEPTGAGAKEGKGVSFGKGYSPPTSGKGKGRSSRAPKTFSKGSSSKGPLAAKGAKSGKGYDNGQEPLYESSYSDGLNRGSFFYRYNLFGGN